VILEETVDCQILKTTIMKNIGYGIDEAASITRRHIGVFTLKLSYEWRQKLRQQTSSAVVLLEDIPVNLRKPQIRKCIPYITKVISQQGI